jgi:hypothetical protein
MGIFYSSQLYDYPRPLISTAEYTGNKKYARMRLSEDKADSPSKWDTALEKGWNI